MFSALIVVAILLSLSALVGSDRATLWTRCRVWHVFGASQVRLHDSVLAIPDDWCAFGGESGAGVSLQSVPLSRDDESIVALVDALPDSLRDCLGDPPGRTELGGQEMTLVAGGSSVRLSGLSAFRMEYRPVSEDEASERYVAWLFPEPGLMVSSLAPRTKLAFFDDFVAELVDRSEFRPVAGGEAGAP